MHIGVEIGGTFTDLVWQGSDGRVSTGKVPSTPDQIHQAVLDAVTQAGIPLEQVRDFSHGSTVATNALLTRRGAQTGLLVTAGFRDVIEIGTHDRVGNIYTAFYDKPRAPVLRRHVREVRERLDADGHVVTPLDLEQAWAEIQAMLDEGITSLAICLLHAWRNPQHEQALLRLIAERAPQLAVCASHAVSPEFREYERTVTTTVNAFVGPVVQRYVQALAEALGERGYPGALRLMQSNGGIMPAAAAGTHAVRMLLSGPAAGVRAALWFARRNQIDDILTLDMGGTSTDVAIAPALTPRVISELVVDHLPIRTTAVDMATVGAGGGSIASVDAGGFLNVGPASAGAYPGPACYGRGGTLPTVTDAQAVAGLLRPARFFGGNLTLRTDLAQAALAGLGLPGGAQGAADAVLRMVDSNMAAAVRLVSTARGIDPRDYTLVAFGGGGPLHGARVADALGMRRVLVPWSPGISSAFGLLVADLSVDVVQARLATLDDAAVSAAVLAEVRAQCDAQASTLGLAPGDYTITFGADLRYTGQGFELPVWFEDEAVDAARVRAAFEQAHEAVYGHVRHGLPVQLVNLRGRILRRQSATPVTPVPDGTAEAVTRDTLVLEDQPHQAAFLPRAALAAGQSIDGPAVLEEPTSTVFVPPGWRATCLPTGDLLLEKHA